MIIMVVLASISTPIVVKSIHRAKESALKENLQVMRKAIDDYYADHGQYPGRLVQLVDERYLRKIPEDPITENIDWVIKRNNTQEQGITDIHSAATQETNNTPDYQTW